jgi:hypothetical protein
VPVLDRARAGSESIVVAHDLNAPLAACNLEHVASPTAALHARFLSSLNMTPEQEDRSNQLLDVETQLRWLRQIEFVEADCHWKRRELALLAGSEGLTSGYVRRLTRWAMVSKRPTVQHIGQPRSTATAARPAATRSATLDEAALSAHRSSPKPAAPRSRCRVTVRLANGEHSEPGHVADLIDGISCPAVSCC